ncbi:Xaa-Pro aminopeptidase [Secundilactobacillus oryzae JCM 18671]|uniref:Xaa-Pro aminopeptidase n=1 Tax=Secundilactobacillus oryzae JCM 18671 TaxID=1291743 RepID=A0A081BFX5_9LACO|nr:Xaa-Pro peptidase family protein [Secundilactobacillus oryzae]GAK46943.1 Xaa-Pro aminopeptidase [Secundilactobacillus oryzae JCM 18671]
MESRVEKLRQLFNQYRIDAYLVANPFNLKYLLGIDTIAGDGYGLITENEVLYITDDRYGFELGREFPNLKTLLTRDYLGALSEAVENLGVTVLGFEPSIAYETYDQLDELMPSDIVPLGGLIEGLREIKDADEIKAIETAGKMTIAGLDDVIDQLQPGMTETEVANQLMINMLKRGVTGTSFDTIVASGYRTAYPHVVPSDKAIQPGELVTIDCGFYFNGYTSDVTRTFVFGEATAKQQEIIRIVDEARQSVIDAVRPGVTGAELDKVGRSIIDQAGYGEAFVHGMGHGIGLDIHEGPNIGRRFEEPLQPGQIITVEPGIYLEGFGGVRIEDDVLVTASGKTVLTRVTD